MFLYQCDSALLCDTVSACTNVAVFSWVTLCVPVPTWQRYVILLVPVQIWQRSLWQKALVLPCVSLAKITFLAQWSTFISRLLTGLFLKACLQVSASCVSEFDCTRNDSQCYKSLLQELEIKIEVRLLLNAVSEYWTKDILCTVTEKYTFLHVEL